MGRLSSAMQSSPAVACMKTLLMVFNFIFWVSGIAILVLGIWMKVQLYIYIELTTVYFSETPYVLIGVGSAIVIVGMLGCCCTVKGNSCFLYLFSAFLIVIFLAELCVGIAGFVYRSNLEEGFDEGLNIAMETYRNNSQKKDAVDGIQKNLKCCGGSSYKDWFKIKWAGDATVKGVPASCCVKEGCTNNPLPPSSNDTVYTEGCMDKITDFMESNFGIIGGVAIGFAFLQLFGALLACGLAKNINRAKYEQVA